MERTPERPDVTHTPSDAARVSALRSVRRTYYFVTSLTWFGNVLPMAIGVLFVQSRGFSLLDVGLFTGIYALTVALLEVPTGGLADTIGRKRVAMLAGALAMASSAMLLVTFSLPMLLAYAVVFGASRALGSGALEAWFVDAQQAIEPDVDLQPPFAMAGTFELFALAAGTLLGGFLPTWFAHLPTIEGHIVSPLATPILASLGVKLLALVAILTLVRETPTEGAKTSYGHVFRDAVALTRGNGIVLALLGVSAASGFLVAGLETFWQPFFAARLGGGAEKTWLFGVIMAGSFGAGMLGNLLAIPMSRWLGRRHARVAALFHALQLAAVLALAFTKVVPAAVALFWIAYLAMGGSGSPIAALFNGAVPGNRRSVMLSVRSLAGFAGAFLGSVVLGWVAESASIQAAWTIAGGSTVLSVVLLLHMDRRSRPAPASHPSVS
ncbi:MAG: MFS transporter [Trueperaceae bacterium]